MCHSYQQLPPEARDDYDAAYGTGDHAEDQDPRGRWLDMAPGQSNLAHHPTEAVNANAADDAGALTQAHQDAFNLLTHNGTITIHNPATGGHRTFNVRTETWNKGEANECTKRVVRLLAGSDNTGDYIRFGEVLVSTDGKAIVKVWKRFQTKEDGSRSDWVTFGRMLSHPQEWADKHGVHYLYSGTCIRCNRMLTVPESIKAGIGPTCAGRV